MGGDNAPGMVLKGAAIAARRFPDVQFILFGDEQRMGRALKRLRRLKNRVTVHHTEDFVTNDDRPSQALRRGKNSSMRLAIDAVHEGRAQGVVSAGNTGALMGMAKLVLRTLPGIDRPAIAGYFPSQRGESVMLDLGANLDCSAENLAQFAVMGDVFARTVLGIQNPSVGLLNVGSEESKGHDEVKRAAAMLRESDILRFHGFVEGDDITRGTADVIVADGFTGNVALKTAEGTARLYSEFLSRSFKSSLASKLGYMLARRALSKLRARLDPRRYNGAMFVGLNGVVVKSHGGTDTIGFANAIGVAVDMAANDFNEKITKELEAFGFAQPRPAAAGESLAAS
jgi:glycerol-3-phosphate acyltransferase PlsX